jgi:methylmalonyl-CoA/ethylmalonyl-CoA epimerase
MFKRIHHIGIAVASLDEGAAIWGPDGIGLTEEGREVVSAARTRVAMFPVGESRIELLEPMGDDSPVGISLAKRGAGIHHICFEVDDIRAEMDRMRGLGMRFTTDGPTPGAHGSLVAFVHPKDTGRVLIELNEFPPNAS